MDREAAVKAITVALLAGVAYSVLSEWLGWEVHA